MVTTDITIKGVGFVPPFRVKVTILITMLVLLLSDFNSIAFAHDPGLSFARLVVEEQSIQANLTFSRRDIELILPLDINSDGEVTSDEWVELEEPLKVIAQHLAEMTFDNRPIQGSVRAVVLGPSEEVVFSLDFFRQSGNRFQYSFSMMTSMALGHRQFVTVMQEGTAIQTEILSASKSEFTVGLAPVKWWRQMLLYVWEGMWHIWIGFDHILFLLAMLLPAALLFRNGTWQSRNTFKSTFVQVVKIVSAFTVAHSITLSLSVFDLIRLDSVLVESVIAASVIVAAVNNLRPFIQGHLWVMSFAFGLIHGLGFASVLSELGLPLVSKGIALLGFNIGVELGQLAIIILVLPLIFIYRNQQTYRLLFLKTGSAGISVVASIWLVERVTGWSPIATLFSLS